VRIAAGSSVSSAAGEPALRTQRWVIAALIAAVGAFDLGTIRDGHDWGGDFAQYIQHARNLAAHRPYADTGYVYNLATAGTGPRAYPPLFPLMLVPVVGATAPVASLDLKPMKVEEVLSLLVALVLIERVLRSVAPFRLRVVTLALFGFNPWLWDFKDQVLSDLPFLVAVYATLWCALALETDPPEARVRWLHAAGVGFFAFVATATRTAGITLLPALALRDLVRERRVRATLVIAAAVYAVGFVAQSRWQPPEASYLDQLRQDPRIVVRNIGIYARALAVFWNNGHWIAPRIALAAIVTGFAACEWTRRVRAGATILEALIVPYVGVVLIWPSEQGTRFLLPLLPLYLVWALLAIERCAPGTVALEGQDADGAGRSPAGWRLAPGVIALLVAAVLTYALRYATFDFHTVPNGVTSAPARELFEFVRAHTDPTDVIAFRKARIVTLYTGRPGVVPQSAPDAELAAYLHSVNVRWAIDGIDEEGRLGGIAERHPEWFEPVFSNAMFRVYRFTG